MPFEPSEVRAIQAEEKMRSAKGLAWLKAAWHDCADRAVIKRNEVFAKSLGYSSLAMMLALGMPLLHSTVTETIGASGDSPDRTSISLWESNLTADATEPQTGECISAAYNHQSSTVTVNVSNANNHALTITVRAGVRITDDANWPTAVDSAEEQQAYYTGSIAWETNNGIVEYLESSMSGFNYAIRQDNFDAQNLTVRYMVWHSDVGASDGRGIRGNNDNDTTSTDGALVTVHNCLGYYLRRAIWPVDHASEIYNVSLALDVGSSTRGIYAHDAGNNSNFVAMIVRNCAVTDFAVDYHEQAAGDIDDAASDYLLSSDATASTHSATTSWNSTSAATFYTDVATAGLDFTPKTDGTYEGDSGNGFTDDIAGSARSDYEIGCIEIVAATTGQPTMLRATTVPGMRQWHPRSM